MRSLSSENTLCIIPARGGSKGVPRKNATAVGGRPLIVHAIEYAQQTSVPMRIVVSTEDAALSSLAQKCGVQVIPRPAELATDTADVADAIHHAWLAVEGEGWIPEILVVLPPAVRLGRGLVERTLRLLYDTGADGVCTVVAAGARHPDWSVELDEDQRVRLANPHFASRRQDLRPIYYFAGTCFCMWRAVLAKGARRKQNSYWFLGEDIRALVIDEQDFVDIDTAMDVQWAEFLLHRAAEPVAERLPPNGS